MASSSSWRTLDFANLGAPKLLTKANITSTGYHVQVTDLCRIWAESLNKKDIIRRAWDNGCSIDPSEDDKQFSIFLDKVEGALNGEDGTTVTLLPGADDDLLLELSAILPKPFATFFWTISLVRQTDDVLADVLTIPLLRQASNLQSQVQQLVHELQEKDRVISKITDRLETSGNDLATVFPGVSNVRTNKKQSQREQLARHVRGLADFDEAEWRSRGVGVAQSSLWEWADGLLRDLPESEGMSDDVSVRSRWWLELATTAKEKSKAVISSRHAEHSASMEQNRRPPDEESMVDDEFQRQATPEHLRRRTSDQPTDAGDRAAVCNANPQHAPKPAPVDDADSTTEDEDDLDAAPKRKPVSPPVNQSPWPTSTGHSAGPANKLGAIGGGSSRPPPSPTREPTPEEQLQHPKSPAKLGAIGGKENASGKSEPLPAEDTRGPTSPAPRKMGIIGGKRKSSDTTPVDTKPSDAAASPEPAKERSRASMRDPTPPPRETSQERADRKRDQLRKELEQKSKAPAKKKRKF